MATKNVAFIYYNKSFMGVNLRWEDCSDTLVHRVLAELRDKDSLVNQFLIESKKQDLPYLHFINPNTLTVFHPQHIPQLIEELEKLSKQQLDPAVGQHLQTVLEFVRKAQVQAYVSVVFIGDQFL